MIWNFLGIFYTEYRPRKEIKYNEKNEIQFEYDFIFMLLFTFE